MGNSIIIRFFVFFRYNTYSVESFTGYFFAIVCCGFLFANKYLSLIPIISAVAAFVLPEYLFSYFQVVNMGFLIQCNKNCIEKAEYKKYVLPSYLLQVIALTVRILLSSQDKIIGFNYFDGNINNHFPIMFLIMAGCITYGYECVKNSDKYIKYSYIVSLMLVPIGNIFLRDIHVFVSAFYLISIVIFVLGGNESIREKIEKVQINYLSFLGLCYL